MAAKLIGGKRREPFTQYIRDTLEVVAETIADDLQEKFEATTKTWKTDIPFIRKIARKGRGTIIEVYTTHPVYRLVNNGTTPHSIRARTMFGMNYQKQFTPKTKPRQIGSNTGGKYGSEWVVRRMLVPIHPGHKSRDFDKVIAESLKTKNLVAQAIREAAREYERDGK